MLGELNWIFTAITDTIAWNTLPRGIIFTFRNFEYMQINSTSLLVRLTRWLSAPLVVSPVLRRKKIMKNKTFRTSTNLWMLSEIMKYAF